ncbi:hypothetical protein BOO86_21815 [Mycobacterium sp. CBMA 234]|uniref:hypothetical protein n=1 Tax=Mycolicibacterium sp. CBMA 234 TaxID=1918495 RepID=UPI001EE3E6F3|nr:hypothetical protein [Mycolicibacterium sp. CBMA 234]MUL67126.1 hypothetical protein [Mycolicibacterium sp. CBMA 234]
MEELLGPVEEAVLDLNFDDRSETLSMLVQRTLERQDLGVLWMREARHLQPKQHDQIAAQLSTIASRLAAAAVTFLSAANP